MANIINDQQAGNVTGGAAHANGQYWTASAEKRETPGESQAVPPGVFGNMTGTVRRAK